MLHTGYKSHRAPASILTRVPHLCYHRVTVRLEIQPDFLSGRAGRSVSVVTRMGQSIGLHALPPASFHLWRQYGKATQSEALG